MPTLTNVGRRAGALPASGLMFRNRISAPLSGHGSQATFCSSFTSRGGKPSWEVRKPRVFAFSTETSVGVGAVKVLTCHRVTIEELAGFFYVKGKDLD